MRTAIVRSGRRIATGEATLYQDGKRTLRVTAAFSELRPGVGRTVLLAAPPELPPPDEAIDLMGGRVIPELSIAERVEYRVARWPGWAQGKPSGRPSQEFWMRYRDGREPDLLSLASLVDAAAPPVLELGETASATIELTVHLRAHPAPGWLACRVATRFVIGGYHEEDFEIWDSTGALVAQSRQLALLP